MTTFITRLALAGTAAMCFAATAGEAEIKDLTAKWAKPGRIAFRADKNGDPVVQLAGKYGTAEIMTRGGKTLSWKPTGGEEVFFVPKEGADLNLDDLYGWLHGGCPIVWPWFGGAGMPQESWWSRTCREWGWSDRHAPNIHGFARSTLFTVEAAKVDGDKTSLVLSMTDSEQSREFVPYVFKLTLTVTLGETLAYSLVTENRGTEEFSLREGYHPYFLVSNCFHTWAQGFDGFHYSTNRRLEHDDNHVWQGDLPISPGCDIFDMKEPKSVTWLCDPGMKRKIRVASTGDRDVLTCCFWFDPSGRQENLPNAEVKRTVCIEPASYNRAAVVTVKPGESHVFTMDLAVEKL